MSSHEPEEPVIKITATENGPYHLEGPAPVSNARGEELETGTQAWLCRCGGSANKPFCDGTHKKNGFDGTCVASRDSMEDRRTGYVRDELTIFDDRTLCAHAGRCTDGLPAVWKLDQEPWIDPQGGTVEQIVETIRQCPSGALTYALVGHNRITEESLDPAILSAPNGPYQVRGRIQVRPEEGEPYEMRNRQTLCRCGHSKNKPFCDGTHWSVGFKDPGLPAETGSSAP